MRPSDGTEAIAVNLRPTERGLAAVGMPLQIADAGTDTRFIGNDRRGNRLYFFAQRQGNVLLAGYRDDGIDFVPAEKALFTTTATVKSIASAGDFVLINTSEGLEYLHYDQGGYEHMGSIEFPVFAFGTTDMAELSETIASYPLEGSYPGWHGTMMPDDATTLARSALNAVKKLHARAKAGQRCMQPLLLRTALRLWDDSLLWSAEATVTGNDYAPPETLANATAPSTDTFRIESSALSLKAWKPAATVVASGIGKWKPFVKAVEIYAATVEPVPDSVSFRCETKQQGSTAYYLRIATEATGSCNIRRTLPHQKQLQLVASISDLDALQGGILRADGITPVSDGAGSQLTGRTFALDMPASKTTASYEPPLPGFAPEALSAIGNRWFAGNATFRLPQPPRFASLWDTNALKSGVASVFVTVELNTSAGMATVASSTVTDIWAEQLNGFACYPDSRAVRMTVTVIAGGQTRQWSAPLAPSPCRKFAYAIAPDANGFALSSTTTQPLPERSNAEWSEPGTLLASATGNPLQWKRCPKASCRGIRAVLPAFGYGSAWQSGRHPAYLFATDGIYLLSFDTKGECSGANLISARQIPGQEAAASTSDGAVFVDSNGEVCRLNRSKASPTGIIVANATAAGYSPRYHEIWIENAEGKTIVTADNSFYLCTASGSLRHFSGISYLEIGQLLHALDKEMEGDVLVTYRAFPTETPCGTRLRTVVWDIVADEADLALSVYGENGRSCHGELFSSLHAAGNLRAPLRHRLIAAPARTIRLSVSGKIPAGTEIRTAKMAFS